MHIGVEERLTLSKLPNQILFLLLPKQQVFYKIWFLEFLNHCNNNAPFTRLIDHTQIL